MLYSDVVSTSTLVLLKRLMQIEMFKGLNLVGGTSLALQLGHRISTDLDLFGKMDPNEMEISTVLDEFEEIVLLNRTANIFNYIINGIKVDLVNYKYSFIGNYNEIEGIRLANRADIAAMKLAAITGRGTKKDFVDLYFLLKEYSLKEIIGFYNTKFPDGSEFLVLKSLSYFQDANNEEVQMLIDIDWEEIKNTIMTERSNYMDEI